MVSDSAVSSAQLPGDAKAKFSTVQIGLRHWLWWLTATAALLAIHRHDMQISATSAQDSVRAAQSRLASAIIRAANFSAAPFQALAVVGFCFAVWNSVKKRTDFPSLPGHWLLVCLGAYVLAHEFSEFAWHRLVLPRWETSQDLPQKALEPLWIWMETLDAARFIAGLLAATFASVAMPARWRWRAVFLSAALIGLIFATINALNAGGYQFFPVTEWTEFIAKLMVLLGAALVLINAAIDATYKCRDLLHWLGIIVAIVLAIHSAAWDFSFTIAFNVIQA